MTRLFDIPLTWKELGIGALLFMLTSLSVWSSRTHRLEGHKKRLVKTPTVIYLHNRVDLSELNRILIEKDVVQDTGEVRWAANLLGWRRFQPGRYEVPEEFTYNSLLAKLARGTQDAVRVTVLPGITRRRFARELAGKLEFDTTAVLNVFADSSYLAEKGLDANELFGRMLPNTYNFYWNASARTLVNTILSVFDRQIVKPNQSKLDSLNYSLNNILTMASIVEWEARADSEKATISGLYWNRLNRGMRLQADPTVNFAVGERRRLLYKDYQVESPFNTYIHSGLPPAPITNPSKSSIMAALYPEHHDYLYMVASPDGDHAFSRTFSEHKRKSAAWRRWLQKQYRIKRQREARQRAASDSSSGK